MASDGMQPEILVDAAMIAGTNKGHKNCIVNASVSGHQPMMGVPSKGAVGGLPFPLTLPFPFSTF